MNLITNMQEELYISLHLTRQNISIVMTYFYIYLVYSIDYI